LIHYLQYFLTKKISFLPPVLFSLFFQKENLKFTSNKFVNIWAYLSQTAIERPMLLRELLSRHPLMVQHLRALQNLMVQRRLALQVRNLMLLVLSGVHLLTLTTANKLTQLRLPQVLLMKIRYKLQSTYNKNMWCSWSGFMCKHECYGKLVGLYESRLCCLFFHIVFGGIFTSHASVE
jgi:hypothetical protein